MFKASESRTRQSSGKYVSLVSDKYRKDYQVPGIDYQQGIRSTTLWPTALTCMRVIPGYDPETGEIYPQNKNCTTLIKNYNPQDYISDTFCEVRTLNGFGESRSNVIANYRPGSPEWERWHGDTVLATFASDINHAVMAAKSGKRTKIAVDPDWYGWTTYNKEKKQASILPFDKPTLLMQALVWTVNGRTNMNKDKQPLIDGSGNPLPVLYVVGIDNAQSLTELYRALIEPQDPQLPLNGLTNNRYHGIAEQGGSLVYMLPGKVRVKDKEQNVLNPHVSDNGSSWVHTPMPLSDEQIKQWWHPWNDVLNFMTPEEQMQLIVDSFPDGAHLLNYFLANSAVLSELRVPDSIAKAGFGKYARYMDGGTVTLTAAPQASAAPAMPTGFGMPGAIPPAPAPGVPMGSGQAPVAVFPGGPTVPAMPSAPAQAPVAQPPQAAMPPFPSLPKHQPIQSSLSPEDNAELAKMQASGIALPRKDDLSNLATELIGSLPAEDDTQLTPFDEQGGD